VTSICPRIPSHRYKRLRLDDNNNTCCETITLGHPGGVWTYVIVYGLVGLQDKPSKNGFRRRIGNVAMSRFLSEF